MKTLAPRAIALLTGSALAASMFLTPAPARADKSKSLKIGALVLGAIGVISAVKGKELPAVVAGAYYAYKKSKDAKNDNYSNNDDYFPGGVYSDSNDGYYNNYPTDSGNYNGGYNGGYTNYPTNNGGYNNYPADCDNNTPYYGNTDDGPYNDRRQRGGYTNRNDRRADYGSQRPYRSLK